MDWTVGTLWSGTPNTYVPPEIEISPVIITSEPGGLLLLACCVHSPYFLPEGQVITQDIPTPTKLPVDNSSPDVYWAEVVGRTNQSQDVESIKVMSIVT